MGIFIFGAAGCAQQAGAGNPPTAVSIAEKRKAQEKIMRLRLSMATPIYLPLIIPIGAVQRANPLERNMQKI